MSSAKSYDAIVVGCGPVGVIAAHLLGNAGISTLVIERDREPYQLPRAIHIDHEIMRILQSAGLAELVLPHLTMPAGAMHFGADRSVIRQFQQIVQTDRLGWGSDYFFYQPDIEQALRAVLEQRETVTVLFGHALTAIEQDGDRVTVTADGGDGPIRASARYLLGCDGGRSATRRCVDVDLDDLGFDEPWIVVDALVDGPVTMPDLHGTPDGVDMQQVMFIVADPARPTSVIPGVGRHRRWEFMMLPGETAADFAAPEAVAPLLAPWLRDSEHRLIRVAVYRFHALLADRWQADRVFLVGDAAHQTPPFFGQGLCHGIRDAANLVWKLKLVLDGTATPALLASYQPERLPQVRGVIEASMRAGRYLCTLDPDAAAKRDHEMRAVVARTAPGYVDIIPPLTDGVLDPATAEGSATGSRFIQPPVLDRSGERMLLDTATGGGFVLLATTARLLDDLADARSAPGLAIGRFCVTDGDGHADERALTDCTGELARWFDHYRCQGMLLRPDGYVYGTFSTADQATAMLGALHRQLAPA